MLMNGFDGQMTTARRSSVGERGEKIRMRPRFGGAGECEFADDRLAAQPHEIILEVEPALVRCRSRVRTGSSRHRQEPRARCRGGGGNRR